MPGLVRSEAGGDAQRDRRLEPGSGERRSPFGWRPTKPARLRGFPRQAAFAWPGGRRHCGAAAGPLSAPLLRPPPRDPPRHSRSGPAPPRSRGRAPLTGTPTLRPRRRSAGPARIAPAGLVQRSAAGAASLPGELRLSRTGRCPEARPAPAYSGGRGWCRCLGAGPSASERGPAILDGAPCAAKLCRPNAV